MWHLKNIPKILHTYWGGGKLLYLRYLTLESFHYYNPDWEIRFYYPKVTVYGGSWNGVEQKYTIRGDDWRPMIDPTVIKMIEVSWDEPVFKTMSEVHRSDYLRLKLLSEGGGLWADLDILFFRPIDNLAINTPTNADKDTVVSIFTYGHSIGFMMASENNEAFRRLEQTAMRDYDPKIYQCMGSELYNKTFPTIESITNGVNLGMEAVYLYNCTQIKNILGDAPSPELNPNAIGTHWYAGSTMAGTFLYKTEGGEKPDDSLLGKLIQKYERDIHKDIQR